MALQSVPGSPLYFPVPLELPAGATLTSGVSGLIDAATERVALVCVVPKTGNLQAFEFRSGTNTTAANGLLCSFQDIDLTNGNPDGTADQTVVLTQASITANSWLAPGNFGATRAVSRGDLLACVIEYTAFAAGDSFHLVSMADLGGTPMEPLNSAYGALFTGTWAKTRSVPLIALRYDDGTFPAFPLKKGPVPAVTVAVTSCGQTTTPDEIGIIFQVPFSCKAGGFWICSDLDADLVLRLYDSDGSTVLASAVLDSNMRQADSRFLWNALFPTDVTLSVTTNYRVAVSASAAGAPGANIITTIQVSTGPHLGAWAGTNITHTQRTDGGAWTQSTTFLPMMGVLLTALDDGVGGAGGGGASQLIHTGGGGSIVS